MENEVWKDMFGYEGLYQASTLGRIKRLKRTVLLSHGVTRTYSEAILECSSRTKKGYVRTNIQGNNTTVHRLIATTFIPNPDNKPQINHKNGIKTDNRVENLEWVTNQENRTHAIENGLHFRGPKPNARKFSDDDVAYILANYNVIPKPELATMFNTTVGGIYRMKMIFRDRQKYRVTM